MDNRSAENVAASTDDIIDILMEPPEEAFRMPQLFANNPPDSGAEMEEELKTPPPSMNSELASFNSASRVSPKKVGSPPEFENLLPPEYYTDEIEELLKDADEESLRNFVVAEKEKTEPVARDVDVAPASDVKDQDLLHDTMYDNISLSSYGDLYVELSSNAADASSKTESQVISSLTSKYAEKTPPPSAGLPILKPKTPRKSSTCLPRHRKVRRQMIAEGIIEEKDIKKMQDVTNISVGYSESYLENGSHCSFSSGSACSKKQNLHFSGSENGVSDWEDEMEDKVDVSVDGDSNDGVTAKAQIDDISEADKTLVVDEWLQNFVKTDEEQSRLDQVPRLLNNAGFKENSLKEQSKGRVTFKLNDHFSDLKGILKKDGDKKSSESGSDGKMTKEGAKKRDGKPTTSSDLQRKEETADVQRATVDKKFPANEAFIKKLEGIAAAAASGTETKRQRGSSTDDIEEGLKNLSISAKANKKGKKNKIEGGKIQKRPAIKDRRHVDVDHLCLKYKLDAEEEPAKAVQTPALPQKSEENASEKCDEQGAQKVRKFIGPNNAFIIEKCTDHRFPCETFQGIPHKWEGMKPVTITTGSLPHSPTANEGEQFDFKIAGANETAKKEGEKKLELVTHIVNFPTAEVGSVVAGKIQFQNYSDYEKELRLMINYPDGVFSIKKHHQRVKVRGRRFINIPVKFVANGPGTFQNVVGVVSMNAWEQLPHDNWTTHAVSLVGKAF